MSLVNITAVKFLQYVLPVDVYFHVMDENITAPPAGISTEDPAVLIVNIYI